MSQIIFGFDLGIASIGWAVILEGGSDITLKGWGSRIFLPGMDDDIEHGKGKSRCADRRMKRALRIQYQRRRKRRNDLIALLQEHGFLPTPLTPGFFVSMDKRFLQAFPKEQRAAVGHVIPYLYRKKALDTLLSKEELGRTLYHLAQRRGYLSNRKQDLKDEENSGVVKAGIDSLRREMEQSGARTLGEYFCQVNPEEDRIRTRYTDRSMYQDEFRKICEAQRAIISKELEEKLFNVIFYQRKLKSCKNLIGACSVYPEEKRCSYACEEAQMFRIYTTLNHLRIEKAKQIRSLSEKERQDVFSALNGYSDLLTRKGTVKLSKLARAIRLGKGEKFTLADDEKEIYGNVLHAALFSVFGSRAEKLSEEDQKKFFNDLNSIEKTWALEQRLKNFWDLNPEQIAVAEKIVLPEEYCAYSLKALKELLPDLKAGIPLATILKLNNPKPVAEEYPLLPILDSEEVDIELRNPVVHRVLTELRTVVNALISRFGKPDRIRIELARDLKSSNKERERRTIEMRKREKERAEIAKKIAKEAGIENPSKKDILKVMLAEECGYECPYTGMHFSMYDLLHGKDIHIEHIIPYSRSYDDSFRNKTLCAASENAKKDNHTPYEAYSGTKYQEILQRVSHFKGPFAEEKLELFKLDKVDSQEFLARNLNDTRYASRLAMQYLGMLYGGIIDKAGKQRVFATSGTATAIIRRAWGGNFLLGEGEKSRDDHLHHAVDALTIALTTPEMVRKIAGMTEEIRKKKMKTPQGAPLPENELFLQAKSLLEKAAVSHHQVNKIRGAFHEETFYSKDYNGERHKKIKLENLTVEDILQIVDKPVRSLILARIGKTEDEIKKLSKAEKKDFDKHLPESLNVSEPLLFTDKNGKPVNTIKAVRVAKKVSARTIGSGDSAREVVTGNNYLLAVFAVLDEQGNETGWEGELVSLLDARLRLIHKQPLFHKERPGRKFKFTLKKGDIVTFSENGKDYLCVIRGISLPQFHCCLVQDARMKKDIMAAKLWFQMTLSRAFNDRMKKYRMDIFGELRRAND